MNSDPFFKPLGQMVPKLGRAFRPKPEEAEPMEADAAPPPAAEEKAKPKAAKLSNPQWDADKVGFNEETPISVDVELPPEVAHKKKVAFELFAKTPKGPERISQGDAMEKDGKATCKIPVYIPNFRDDDGNRLQKVEYYFLAKHSEADPLDASKSPKVVDEMADRLIESHILPDITFATGSSFLHPDHAAELKGLRESIKAWKKKTPEGKLAVFGHADAVGKEADNKTLSERRGRALLAFLTLDAAAYAAVAKEESWKLDAYQSLLKFLGHDPGALDGQDGPKTQAAVKSFRKKQGLAESGGLDAGTKEKLYAAFFAEGNSEAVPAKDFDDVNGNAFAGCSEFNLAEKTQGACEKNRRVGVFLLKATKNFPINYPCAKGDIGVCKKQVAKKGDRRTAGFGCWFYDQLIVERPNQPPPPPDEPISDLKWDVETAWCGDTAKLTATSNLPDGTEVSIKLATEDQTCEEAKAKVQGGKLEFPWTVKNIPFAVGEDKKPKPEMEIFAKVTAQGKAYDAKKNLKAKKLVEAKAEEFSDSHSWGTKTKYLVKGHFFQSIEGNKAKVTLKKKVMKTWGATYVSVAKIGITNSDGLLPWAGMRWARCPKGSMTPTEYWDQGKWNKIKFNIDATDFGTLPIVKTGEKYHWVGSQANVYPGTFDDYKWEAYQGKRDAWTKDSNSRWTGAHTVKRKACAAPKDKACCTYGVEIDFSMEKVEAYSDEVICLAPMPLRSNAGLLFYDDSRIAMCAHEVGHLVGQPDEYNGGAVDTAVNGDGAKDGLDGTTLMGSDLTDESNNKIKVRHFMNFAVQMRVLFKKNGGKDEEWIVSGSGAAK
jgi:outer membrane protein OmpA-like peptidoglycan-associated protein